MRRLVAMGAGAVLALLLFFGLALLVAPPEALQQPEQPLTITMTEASAPSEATPTTQPTQAPSPPVAPPRPAAVPPPAPDVQSSVTLPQSDAPPPERPDVELDAKLPTLDVERPAPAAKPAPKPQPRPQPRPAPTPEPAPASQPSSTPAQRNSATASSAQAAQDLLSAQQKGLIKPVRLEKPEYPRRARMRGTEGFVEVQFMIQTSGRVDRSSIKIIDSRPGSTFDDAAREAVSSWVFQSLDRPVRIIQRLEFKLRG